jgi:hypothetical protein
MGEAKRHRAARGQEPNQVSWVGNNDPRVLAIFAEPGEPGRKAG